MALTVNLLCLFTLSFFFFIGSEPFCPPPAFPAQPCPVVFVAGSIPALGKRCHTVKFKPGAGNSYRCCLKVPVQHRGIVLVTLCNWYPKPFGRRAISPFCVLKLIVSHSFCTVPYYRPTPKKSKYHALTPAHTTKWPPSAHGFQPSKIISALSLSSCSNSMISKEELRPYLSWE